jgi:type VI secretion system protein ImpF
VAELTPQERLQPSLLDRLTDDEPSARTESREQRVLSPQRLRAALLRDLAWLLNTGHLQTVADLDDHLEVKRSVLNYGIPDLTGLTIAGADTARIEKAVRQAIVDYEPRIAPESLRVSIETTESATARRAMVFRIEGALWAKPAPQALYLKTEVDLDTGDVRVNEGQG